VEEDLNEDGRRLLELVKDISKLSVDELVGKARLGDLSFEAAEPMIRRILAIISELRELPLALLPENTIRNLLSLVKQANERLSNIKSFSAAQAENPGQARQGMIKTLRDTHEGLFNSLAPSIAYLRTSPDLLRAIEARASEASQLVSEHAKAVEGRLSGTQKEAEEILTSLRRTAADVGVSQHAVHFLNQATEHRKAANLWLAATLTLGAFGLAGAVVLLYLTYTGKTDYTTASGVQLAIAKLLAFSLLYFIAIICAKNYGAHRHNYVVNKHRQNALSTFEAFVKATADVATRDAVLLRSTEAIFAPLASGYGHPDAESPPTPQILEIIRGGLGKST